MVRQIGSRIVSLIVLLWIVSLATFALTLLIPGDPTVTLLGENATPDQVARLRTAMGLDRPLLERYFSWLGGVLQGNLGTSLFSSYSVGEAIVSRIGVTVALVSGALVISILLGIVIGVLAGSRPGSLWDRLTLFLSSVGIAVPNFWLGILLVTVFGLLLRWVPSGGYVKLGDDPWQWAVSLALPVLTLAAGGVAEIARQARASMIDVLQMDFVRTLHAKGVPPRTVLVKHALRTALIPVVTVAGLQVSRLFGLSVLVETVFTLPGIGSMMVAAVFDRDIPMVQGAVLLSTVIVVVVNLLVDLSYQILSPRSAS